MVLLPILRVVSLNRKGCPKNCCLWGGHEKEVLPGLNIHKHSGQVWRQNLCIANLMLLLLSFLAGHTVP